MTKKDLPQVCEAGSALKKSVNVIHYINRLKTKITLLYQYMWKNSLTKSNTAS